MTDDVFRCLVADDTLTMRAIIKKFLSDSSQGEILEASDGLEAWEILESSACKDQPISLILSDNNMPKMKGVELLKKVRSTKELSSIPFIMITAETEKQSIVDIIKAGVTDFVLKPFSNDELLEKLKRFLP